MSSMPEQPPNLDQLLDRFCSAPVEQTKVTLGSLVEEVGTRSFGPLLLFAGVILTSPVSGIPGVPSSMGVFVFLISLQLLCRREHFWLPGWLLRRKVARRKIERAVKLLRRPARFIDRLVRPRLSVLVRGPGMVVIAGLCALMSLAVPAMETVPFSATLVGAAFTAFGLALTVRDGVVALLGFLMTTGAAALMVHAL